MLMIIADWSAGSTNRSGEPLVDKCPVFVADTKKAVKMIYAELARLKAAPGQVLRRPDGTYASLENHRIIDLPSRTPLATFWG